MARKSTEVATAEPRSLTPPEMLSQALASGASAETLAKLMELQERWEARQSKHAFDGALAKAKADIPAIIKDAKVDYKVEGKPRVNYQYETFAAIDKVVRPILQNHGLHYRFKTESTPQAVTVTCIIEGYGHSEENSLTASSDNTGGKNSVQAIGSSVQYLQRYTLKAGLGLAVMNKDDDAKGATDGGYIGPDDIKRVKAELDSFGADYAQFLEYIGAESFETILRVQTKQVNAVIKQAKKARAKASKDHQQAGNPDKSPSDSAGDLGNAAGDPGTQQ
jgi:hypothetical protein